MVRPEYAGDEIDDQGRRGFDGLDGRHLRHVVVPLESLIRYRQIVGLQQVDERYALIGKRG